MKRILFLVVLVLCLVACSADSLPGDGLANSAALGWDEGVAAVYYMIELPAEQVWTDMRPLSATNQATVFFRVKVPEDKLPEGYVSPYFHGSGILQVQDKDFVFEEQTPIQAEGKGQLRLFLPTIPNESEGAQNVHGLPIAEISAELGAGLQEVVIVGAATGEGQETAVLLDNEGIYEISDVQCEGRTIPNSNMAQMRYKVLHADGEEFIGAGIGVFEDGPVSDTAVSFQCNQGSKGYVTQQMALGPEGGSQAWGTILTDLKIQTEKGQSHSLANIFVQMLVLGDGNTLLNFNIGMPPT